MYGLINQPAVFMTEDDLKSRSDELLYGWAVKATGEKEDFWYVTSHYGYKGYVPKAAVTPVSLEEIKAPGCRGGTPPEVLPVVIPYSVSFLLFFSGRVCFAGGDRVGDAGSRLPPRLTGGTRRQRLAERSGLVAVLVKLAHGGQLHGQQAHDDGDHHHADGQHERQGPVALLLRQGGE